MITNTMKSINTITGGELTLGKAMRAIRLCDEITQQEFAKKLGVTQSYLCNLEHDRKEVSPQKAAEFAEILHQSKEQFLRFGYRKGFDYEVELHRVA